MKKNKKNIFLKKINGILTRITGLQNNLIFLLNHTWSATSIYYETWPWSRPEFIGSWVDSPSQTIFQFS